MRCPASCAVVTESARAKGWSGPTQSRSGSSRTGVAVMPSGSRCPGMVTARKVASMAPSRRAVTAVSTSNSVTTSSAISGCARWKCCTSPPVAARRPTTSTRSARSPGRTAAVARSSARSRTRACGSRACPSMVSSAPRGVRTSSRTPRSFSSAAIRLDTACWVRARSTAAFWNCPESAIATKARTALRSTRGSLAAQHVVVGKIECGRLLRRDAVRCTTMGCAADVR